MKTVEQVKGLTEDNYKYGFVTDIESETAPKGLNEDIVRFISAKKNEPEWLLEWRRKSRPKNGKRKPSGLRRSGAGFSTGC